MKTSCPLSSSGRRSPFTIMGISIAPAVIGILAGLLLPALAGSLRQTKVVACDVVYLDADGYPRICRHSSWGNGRPRASVKNRERRSF